MCSARVDRAGRRFRCLIALLVWLAAGRAAAGERSGELPPAFPPPAFPPLLVAVESARMPERPPAGTGPGVRRGTGERRLTTRLCMSAALAASSGLVAWWSRERADRAYARYMRAAGLRRQEAQFARAERYDRVAGIALVGMEFGLALTTYLLFF